MARQERVDVKAILADPDLRRKLMVRLIRATQALAGIDTTEEQAERAYYAVTEGERNDASRFRERGVLSADSSPAVERLQIDAWRQMSPVQKARTVDALTRTVQVLALAGIRERHPDASERECFLRLAVLKLGGEATRRLYPDAAAVLERSA